MYGLGVFALTTLVIANQPKPLFERQDLYTVVPGATVYNCPNELKCGGFCRRQTSFCCNISEYQSIFLAVTLNEIIFPSGIVTIADYLRPTLPLCERLLLPRFQRMLY